jgi:hypothetical protein
MALACTPVITPEDIEANGCACNFDFAAEGSTEILEAIADAVTDVLVKVSGYRWQGQCETTIVPCRECCAGHACGCCRLHAIELERPVVAISSVTIDDEDIEFKLFDGNMLVRADGKMWPGCQDLLDPSFLITYTWGQTSSKLEFDAGMELACDLLRSCSTGKSRSGGTVVKQISGQGVSASLSPSDIPFGEFPAVSKFAAFWNPDGTKVPTLVYSPELADGWTHHTVLS